MECEHCGARTHLCKLTINRTWAIQKTEYILCERCVQKIEAFICGEARFVKKRPDNSAKLDLFVEV
jgi:DNA-directed RNA polymerase subunit RPC12/RpoP